MAKTKTAGKAVSAAARPGSAARAKEAVQDALQTTWLLKGNLKNAQLAYLRVGVLLAKVRDLKLHEALGHPDLESYAQERLNLGRSSLYNYLRIHDWVGRFHPAWLKPKAKGLIPDLSDVGSLMWIETELARTDLDASRRAVLETLRQKGLDGTLRRSEVKALRQEEATAGGTLKALLASLQTIRKRAGTLTGFPPEALAHLDAAIELATHENSLHLAGFRALSDSWPAFQTTRLA